VFFAATGQREMLSLLPGIRSCGSCSAVLRRASCSDAASQTAGTTLSAESTALSVAAGDVPETRFLPAEVYLFEQYAETRMLLAFVCRLSLSVFCGIKGWVIGGGWQSRIISEILMADEFLESLLATPGTSGFEQKIQQVVRDFVRGFSDSVETDVHGNVIAAVNPDGGPRILLDAHCDQIGLIVRHIDDKGFIRVSAVGGWDMQILLGQKMLVHTTDGSIPGVIARKPIHLLSETERKTVPKIHDLWIDIGSASAEETSGVVAIGDSVTPQPSLTKLRNGRISGVAMDDRTGIWVIMTALKMISEQNPAAAVFAVSAVQEEIGLRGAQTSAYNVNPDVAIAVDVTHATDCPGIDQNQFGNIKIGGGPVVVRGANANPRVVDLLLTTAAAHDISVQINALGRPASNDGAAIQVSRGGCAAGLVTLPNRYMHSPVEVVAESDLEQSARLLAEFCLAVSDDTSFIP
jgi:tetrahedral aminopeptidase